MSIKITPDKYPQIIEVYNTEGKTAAYDLMRSCYEIKNPNFKYCACSINNITICSSLVTLTF